MNPSFHSNISRQNAALRVALFGDFDMNGVLRLEPQLGRALDEGRVEEVELDLSGLQFVDSTGLGVVLELYGRAREGEFAFSIVPGPRQVQRVFEVTRLDEMLPFTDQPSAKTDTPD